MKAEGRGGQGASRAGSEKSQKVGRHKCGQARDRATGLSLPDFISEGGFLRATPGLQEIHLSPRGTEEDPQP